MNIERLKRYLNSVGKECFVNYFDMFIDSSIPNYEIVERIFKERDYTEKSCNSRTGHARMIIREGGAKHALQIVVDSKRVSPDTVALAKKLLASSSSLRRG